MNGPFGAGANDKPGSVMNGPFGAGANDKPGSVMNGPLFNLVH